MKAQCRMEFSTAMFHRAKAERTEAKLTVMAFQKSHLQQIIQKRSIAIAISFFHRHCVPSSFLLHTIAHLHFPRRKKKGLALA